MKKLCTLLLGLMLMLAATPALAASSGDGLQKAITTVKAVADIPSSYSDFTYSEEESEDGGHQWYLHWRQENVEDGGSISAVVSQDGTLLSYYQYEYVDQTGLSKLSASEGKAKAEAFLKKAMPNDYASMQATEQNGFQYEYCKTINGIMVLGNTATVSVNIYTGKIESFDRFAPGQAKQPETQQIINEATAKKAYLEQFGVELVYASNYDYKAKKINVFPVYKPAIVNNKGIHAVTGDPVEYSLNRYGYAGGAGAKDASADSAGDGENALSPEEISAIQQQQNFISKTQAETVARNNIPNLSSAFKLQRIGLSASYYDLKAYFYNMTFYNGETEIYAEISAQSGKLLSFRYYAESTAPKDVSYESAKAQVEAFVKKVTGDQYASLQLLERQTTGYDAERYYTFTYNRLVNDLKFIDNGVNVRYDKNSGQIASYDFTWYNNVEFSPVSNPLSQEDVFDKMAASLNFDVYYVASQQEQLIPVYLFQTNYQTYFDPTTGQRLGRDGKPYQSGERPSYTDLKGHWCEATVNKLLENDIYLTGETFRPDEAISQVDFLRYLFQMPETAESDLYQMLIRQKMVTASEQNPGATISKLQAAKFIVRSLGYEKVAQAQGIFQYPFRDKIANDGKGYVAICYGLGIVSGNNGSFYPNQNITRAEAATMIYQTKNLGN